MVRMKTANTKIFLTGIICFLAITLAKGQIVYSPNTYYLIPPTAPCNGVWAIQDSLHCPAHIIDPCFQFDHYSGDTLFLKLCSLPCNYVSAQAGNICVVATCSLSANSITENEDNKDEIKIFANPASEVLNIKITGLNNTDNAIIEVIDLQGKSIIRRNYTQEIDIRNLNSGMYILRLQGEHVNIVKKWRKE